MWNLWKTWKAALVAVVGCGLLTVLPARAQQASNDLEVVEVQPNFYMLAGAGANIAAQIGPAGIILVDTGSAAMSAKVLATLKKLSDRPIRYIFDTSADPDHVGGNAILSKAGVSILAGAAGNPAFGEDVISNNGAASVFAQDNVIAHMSQYPEAQWPSKTFTAKLYTMSLNGEGIEIFYQPAAHSDGDSFVLFRRANVIATGDLFDPTRFPVIETDKGGSIQGELDALNHLLELTIPPYPLPWLPERTLLVPGHGPVSDSHDLLEYRDMVTIVRDVIQDMIKRGMTLEQVKAANPTNGYNKRYGSEKGPWTTEMFVTAVYNGLAGKAK
jgi:cyclase